MSDGFVAGATALVVPLTYQAERAGRDGALQALARLAAREPVASAKTMLHSAGGARLHAAKPLSWHHLPATQPAGQLVTECLAPPWDCLRSVHQQDLREQPHVLNCGAAGIPPLVGLIADLSQTHLRGGEGGVLRAALELLAALLGGGGPQASLGRASTH